MKVNIGDWQKSVRREINITIQDFDTYNLDETLAMIIYPALLQFKATKTGMPMKIAMVTNHDQQCFDFFEDEHIVQADSWTKGLSDWDEILDKMIWAFDQIIKRDNLAKYVSVHDTKGLEMHEARIQEGLELFGKHYRSLWN
jgi:hypothetical protein